MKKLIYSVWLKLAAVILLVVCIVAAMLTVSNTVIRYDAEEMDIYDFGRDFSDSWYLSSLLSGPENVLYNAYLNAYLNTYRPYDSNGYPVDYGSYSEVSGEDLEENIRRGFDTFSHSDDEIRYFVQWNDMIRTNCGAASVEDALRGKYFFYVSRSSDGNITRESAGVDGRGYYLEEISHFDDDSTIVIGCSIRDDVAAKYEAIWNRQESLVMGCVFRVLALFLAALALFVYLLCVCGRNAEGEHRNMWVDNIWLEVHLALIVGAAVGTVALWYFVLDAHLHGNFPQNLLYWVLCVGTALGSLIVINSLLSAVRNIKTRRLVSTSIILRIIRWILRLIVKIAKAVRSLFSKKTGLYLGILLFLYTAIIGIFGLITWRSPVGLILGILLFGLACFVAACRAGDLEEIKKGVSAVRSGNVAYQIPELKCDDMKALAEDINGIAAGLDESVAAKVKAERMKTELITNVSHDLKTPITSIVSYTELLSKMEELPEEAKDYVAVIAKKSERLKRLTQDLFDISKVQSGNDEIVFEKLDAALLISQALGEHDNEIQNSGLPFCVDTPKELYISADGRKLSRVVSNLIDNILKYTMKNTRVFITASEKDGMVEMEFKNISSYPLNFNAEEITGRFVRGDESRTAEGHGLGLAIAKSYTEICGGSFEIVVDGDMFKAILRFRKYV